MSISQPRRPAGTPSGGQYATKAHPEPGFDLDGDQGDGTVRAAPTPPAPLAGHAHTFNASELTCDTCGTDIKDVEEPAAEDPAATRESVVWRTAGISRHEARTWLLVTAYQDPPITASEAAEWSRGMRVIQAGSWRGAGFTVDDAAAWSNAGFAEPADAIRWIGEGIGEPDTAKGWQTKGFAAPEARSWVDRGFSAPVALRWANAGFSPSEARQACRGGRFDPSEVDAGGW